MKLLLAALLALTPLQRSDLMGDWTGYLTVGEQAREVHLTVVETGLGQLARLAFLDLGRRYIVPITSRDSVRLALQTPRYGYVEIAASVADDRMAGSVTGSARGTLALRRIDDQCEVCNAAAGQYVSGLDTLLLTFRPRGGMLVAVYGPESISVGKRFPVDGRLVRLTRNGDISETMTVHRDRAGRVRALERRDDGGDVSEWRRIDDGMRLGEVRFRSGETWLAGTLFRPESRRPIAAIAAIHGSLGGRAATRENFWQLHLARALVNRGIAVLLPDKRGSGSSEGEWTIATIEQLADDAEASVNALRDLMPQGGPVGIGALSEGGWVAPVVASRPGTVDFVVSISSSVLSGADNSIYEITQLARKAGLSEDGVAEIVGLQRLAAAYARSGDPADWERYLAQREQLLERPELAEAVRPFPVEPGHPRMVQFVHRQDFDPMPYWDRVNVPVFAVWGGNDIRVPGALSYERLGALFDETDGVKNPELTLYEASGHAIEDPETGLLREEFVDRLVRWLERLF